MSKLPSLGPSLTHHLVENQRQMRRQASSSSFNRSGMSATAEGETTVDGTLIVTGDLEVSGHAAITGTLSLPSGIIGNDALTSPVMPESRWLDSSNWGLTVAWQAKVTIPVTVPAGFTTLQVMAAGRLCATNSTATQDGLYTELAIGSHTQPGFVTGVDPGKAQTSVSTLAATIGGLTPGGTVNIVLWGSTLSAAWATSANNAADLSASLLWLR